MTEATLVKANELLHKIIETKNAISTLVEYRNIDYMNRKISITFELKSLNSQNLFIKFREELINDLAKELNELKLKLKEL